MNLHIGTVLHRFHILGEKGQIPFPIKTGIDVKETVDLTKYVINGGKPLNGEVTISGAKNAAVAIVPAALLVDGPCRIENVPKIIDVTLQLEILRELGVSIRLLNSTTVEVSGACMPNAKVPYELMRKIRASYYLIGALLGKYHHAEVAMPGGCNFGGIRPIDQHIKGFEALGAKISIQEGGYIHADQA